MEQANPNTKRIYTIGHSNHTTEAFAALLGKYGVTMVVDVRSAPYSKFAPQFNKDDLQRLLAAEQIRYRYSGRELGGMPKDESLHSASGKPDYDKIAATPEFQSELNDVVDLAGKEEIAIMCSEGDPMACHREKLIARVLRQWGVEVLHIAPDGEIRIQEQGSLF